MPKWLTLILEWGGVAVVGISVIALIYVMFMPTPEAGATPGETAAPITLYWVLLVIGVVAATIGFVAERRRKPAASGDG